MTTATRIFACMLWMGLYAATSGCDEVIPFTVPTGDPVPGAPGSQDGPGQQGPQNGPGGSGAQDGPGEQGQEPSAAEQLQQTLSGQRLTYQTSSGDGQMYTSQREDIDLCSSGHFQIRTVSETTGYGTGNVDVRETSGTWRIVADGPQLLMELDKQQDTNGEIGIYYFPVALGAGSDFYFNGYLYSVGSSPICN